MSYQDRNREKIGEMIDLIDWSDWDVKLSLFLFVQRRRRRLSFSFILPIDDFQSMLLVYWGLDLFHLFFSLSRLSQCWARGGGDQEVIQSIEDVKVNLLLFSCSFVSESKSLRWCFDFTLEYLLDDESSRVGEVVVIDDVAVVVTAATAASRQPPTYGILCLLFVCESCIFFLFLFHWERQRDMIQYNANLSSFQLVTYQ